VDNYHFLIKIHPEEDPQKYEHLKDNPNIYVYVYEDYLRELLRTCDVLITSISTTALEAMILNKPVITLVFCSFLNKQTANTSPYINSGAMINVYKAEDLVPAIKDVFYDEEVRQKLAEARAYFVYEHAYKQDEKASERVANLIVEMIEESKIQDK
jgi:CDP-glycerol glycerophosphotransferase (TagB/SpsB family)